MNHEWRANVEYSAIIHCIWKHFHHFHQCRHNKFPKELASGGTLNFPDRKIKINDKTFRSGSTSIFKFPPMATNAKKISQNNWTRIHNIYAPPPKPCSPISLIVLSDDDESKGDRLSGFSSIRMTILGSIPIISICLSAYLSIFNIHSSESV